MSRPSRRYNNKQQQQVRNEGRKLFDPFSDNPIEFNKSRRSYLNQHQEGAVQPQQPQQEPQASQQQLQRRRNESNNNGIDYDVDYARRDMPSGRKLWDGDGNKLNKKKQFSTKHLTARPEPSSIPELKKNPLSHQEQLPTSSSSPPPLHHQQQQQQQQQQEKQQLSKSQQQKQQQQPKMVDQHKRKIKLMLVELQQIETKIATLWTEASELPFFKSNNMNEIATSVDRRRQQPPERYIDHHQQLTVGDLQKACNIWNQKMELHINLANKYLDIIQFDYAFAEKKSLENLCWKRAIYSLVEQFRQALKIRTKTKLDDGIDVDEEGRKEKEEDQAEEKEEEFNIEIPVISETGMTMVALSSDDDSDTDDDIERERNKYRVISKIEETIMVKRCFNKFLDLADDFYRRSMVALHAMDEAEAAARHENYHQPLDTSTQDHLQEWRRTRRLKWYKCVPNRGDLARYRWACCSEDRQLAFNEAWRWYAMGAWLMPATGKLYFHLSLLMSDSNNKDNMRQDMHRFYFSTRSLMVRRNGFLNAREGMIVLFESNRQWVDKYLKSIKAKRANNKRVKRGKQQQQQQAIDEIIEPSSKDAVAGLFMRLHGMMFTKIGLDQFAQVKRRFFEVLFPSKTDQQQEVNVEFHSSNANDDIENDGVFKDNTLSGQQMFWFETIVLCLSSLYSYEYSASKLSRLMILHGKQLFATKFDGEIATSSPSPDYQKLLDDFKESILFTYDIDLMCQIATELFQRYLNTDLPTIAAPQLPPLPRSPLSLEQNQEFMFEPRNPTITAAICELNNDQENDDSEHDDEEGWLIYIEILLHWMVVNCVCMRTPQGGNSLWESIVGNISTTTSKVSNQGNNDESKVNPAFWLLLLQFLNKMLNMLPEDIKYELVNRHLLDDEAEGHIEDGGMSEQAFAKLVSKVLGEKPELPEEDYMRGLGWVDDVTGRLLKMNLSLNQQQSKSIVSTKNQAMQRKIKVLDYAFALIKQMHHVLSYDPVLEIFTSKTVDDQDDLLNRSAEEGVTSSDLLSPTSSNDVNNEEHDDGEGFSTALQAMDDAVLFSNENDSVDEDGDDDMLTQLKKRRELLQTMLTTTTTTTTTKKPAEENKWGYRRAPARLKEREARLNRLRERVIPGKTTIILDTNCFIGHFDHVKRLIKSNKWSIVLPLVVITELDGLRSNAPPLGSIADNALKYIETTLAAKQRGSTPLRIQTSHNNFMHDIAIRSEQFMFGETDKNLDDLVLSACLWWAKENDSSFARVCLVTGDRNLSVKARARDIDVMSVSAIIQLTPR
ncbi:hypothetical protein INT45_013036 [Circinella minor]|uniref:PIN domain-containing protein n=1 Tax=Circinella minor TaxID=1195481 RepID=A0A8H7S109_9FUNG|nr:hypothetical protein INT45_013036 [Circinella minor]